MPNSYASWPGHIVFSTSERRPLLTDEIRPRVFDYITAITSNLDSDLLAIGGVEDHIHILARLHVSIAPAEYVRVIKTNSSRWMRREVTRLFAWQRGFAGFAVSQSNVAAVARYVEDQEAHHRKWGFAHELKTLLERHAIPYDEVKLFR